MKIEKLGEDYHLTWFADVEQVLKIRECWEATQSDPPEAVDTVLARTAIIPSKADLTLTLAAADTTPQQKEETRVLLRALEWRRKDEVAKAIMQLNVQPIHHATFRVSGTARAVWMQLQQTVRSGGMARGMEMRRQLATMRKTEKEGMTEYINRGSMLQYEMRQLDQEPKEVELVAALLSGLPPEYDTTVQPLEVLEISTLGGITDRLVTAEVKIKRHESEREAAAFPARQTYDARARPPPPPAGADGDPRICFGCGGIGHIRRDCRTHSHVLPRREADRGHVHWRPPSPPRRDGYNGNDRGPALPGGGLAMMAIATIGHDGYAAADGQDVSATITARDDVDERGRYEAVSPLAATQRDAADADDIVHIDADERALVAVGTTAMAATADHPAYETDWIIDSGASHHMTGNVHALTDIHATGPVSITVASGLKTVATTAGTARVTLDTGMGPKSTVLRDVLLAPGLAVNLFSIKSIMTHGCLAFFSNGGVTVNTKENVCFQGRTRGAATVKAWEAAVGRPAKMYRTDRGAEFQNRGMDKWASEEGFVHQMTAPYTPQQNGKAERFNRSFMEKVTTVMKAAKCDKALWAEAAATVVYAMNRTARAGQLLTPHELWCGQRPSVAHMRTFGCVQGQSAGTHAHTRSLQCAAYVLTPAKFRRKLDPRGRKGIFVGDEPDSKAYRIWVSGKIVVSRDVVFDEGFMGDNVTEPPAEAAYDCTDLLNDDSDTDACLTTDVAANMVADSTDVVQETAPEGVDVAPNSTTNDDTAGTNETNDTTLASTAADMAAVIDAAHRASGLHTPRVATGEELGATAPPTGADDDDGTPPVPPAASTRYPSRTRTAPARLGEGDAHVSVGCAPDDAHICKGAALAVSASGPAAGVDDASVKEMRALLMDGAFTWEVAPDPNKALYKKMGEDLLRYKRGDTDGPVMGYPDVAWISTLAGAGLAARKVAPNNDKMTLAQARLQPDWPDFDISTHQEVHALWRNATFELVRRPPGEALLPMQILCERKRGPVGEVRRHKSRAVVCGNLQVFGRDHTEVWAPVARKATLMALLAVAAADKLLLYQLDVETAFLNGPVEEELYVRQPKGYERGDPTLVFRLRKALYGLKQAARQWYLELVNLMLRMGMTQSDADPCLFYHDGDGGRRMFVLFYVDDILLAAANQSDIEVMKEKVMTAFASRDIGPPTFFLGLHIWRSDDLQRLTVCQRQYVKTLLERNGLTNANRVQLPIAVGVPLQKDGDALDDKGRAEYQALIGGLLYLASCTRPDISFAVGRLARYGAAPTVTHQAAAKTVLRYLKGTTNWGLQYTTQSPLLGYSDTDYAGDVDTRRSTTGYTLVMNGGAISWQSKVQPTVATSTTEAEYIAAAQASREAILWEIGPE
eukprot:contig_9108_g2168